MNLERKVFWILIAIDILVIITLNFISLNIKTELIGMTIFYIVQLTFFFNWSISRTTNPNAIRARRMAILWVMLWGLFCLGYIIRFL